MKLKSLFFRGYEQETGESSWTPPDDTTSPVVSKSWATFYDDDGNIFYYNHVCGVDVMYAKRFFGIIASLCFGVCMLNMD
jgi:hypothetical protein